MGFASWHKHILHFDRPRGTSRGAFTEKPSWFIVLHDKETQRKGIGECGLLPGLSFDDRPEYEEVLSAIVSAINDETPIPNLTNWPSLKFGLEMAQAHLKSGRIDSLLTNNFSQLHENLEINGLVWMGSAEDMKAQIGDKLAGGFTCIKLKIGAINFVQELELIKSIRTEFTESEIGIRVDANGAFAPEEALEKLKRLSDFQLHSIEQPIKAGQWEQMANLCSNTPLDIALDEELIGVSPEDQENLISTIQPQAIILKPSLIGGWAASDRWIELAEKNGAYWWLTSALESNIGLNAIAQYASHKKVDIPQGLGTGMLYTNNFESPLTVTKGEIAYHPNKSWQLPFGL